MIAAIHQSQYLPWPPYFKKIAAADVFVLMDRVQFQKNGVQNRNQIRNSNGAFWLTIPVTGKMEDTIQFKPVAEKKWSEKHWKSVSEAYRKAPFWKEYEKALEELYLKEFSMLGEANEAFLLFFFDRLKLKTKILRLSSLSAGGNKSDLVLNICKEVGADVYLSGMGGKEYLDEPSFRNSRVELRYLDCAAPAYKQFHGEFIPSLSIVDMLFNVPLADIQGWLAQP